MIPIKRVGLVAGAAALTLTGGSFADTSLEAQNDELRARVSELESRLATVEAQNDDNWLTEQRATEIKSLVQDVLSDADTRSSLLAQGMTAGYDDGAVIASADGNWMLRTNIHVQTRFMINNADGTGAGVEDTLWGFEVSRAKFILTGNVVSPEWYYKVEIDLGANTAGRVGDGRGGREDTYIGYDYGNGFKVQIGTMKVPFLYEELVDSRYQQAVERSLVNYTYTPGRSDGIMLEYAGDQFAVAAMWDNGSSDLIYLGGVPGGPSAALVADTDFAFAARVDWLAMGTWDQFEDLTSPRGEEMGLKVGGAIRYQTAQGTAGPLLVPPSTFLTNDILQLTLDASWEAGGGNVYGALIYTDVDASGIPGLLDPSQIAIVVGGGYYFTEDWEVFGRYEWSDLDLTGVQDISIFTIGVNKYFAGHNAKWTTDIGFGIDTIPVAAPVTGYRVDAAGQDGQVVLRSQLQIVF